MFPKRLSRTPSALLTCTFAVSLSSLVGGCGGSSTPRTTLPHEEGSLLTLLPNDAFLAGRLDVAALRGTPDWAGLMDQLRDDEPELVQYAEGTRHVYFGIGGLVDVPPPPPEVDEQGNYQVRPAWVEWSEAFGGQMPAAVMIIEGAAAQLCTAIVAEREHHSEGGFEVTDMDGVAVLTRGDDFCAATFTPLVAALLAEPEGTPSIVDQLGGEGGPAVARLALALDSPTVSSLLDRLGEPDPDAPEPALPADLSEEDAAQYREASVAMRRQQERRADFARSALRIVAHGLTGVSWQIASNDQGFETRTHVVGLDESRLGMWREVTQMFFDILAEAVRTETAPSDEGTFAEFVRSVLIEEVGDGYLITRHTRHQYVARLLERMVPGPAGDVAEAVMNPEDFEAQNAREMIYQSLNAGPEAVIAAIEPNLQVVRASQNPMEQREFLTALADAYRHRGRYADAVTVLTEASDAMRATANDPEGEYWHKENSANMVCMLAATTCELHLSQGHAELALAATTGSRPLTDVACTQQSFEVTRCAAAANSALGRVDQALTQLEEGSRTADSVAYVLARARVLLLGGRAAEALTLSRLMCVGGPSSDRCGLATVPLLESLAAGADTLAAAQPTLTALAPRIAPDVPRDAVTVRLEAADCVTRARLDTAAESTRTACALALEHAIAFHGENHEVVATIRVAYARALDRARQRAEATAQRTAAQPIIDGLGPQHPLRARPAR